MSFHITRSLDGVGLASGKYPTEFPKLSHTSSEPGTLLETPSASPLHSNHTSVIIHEFPPNYPNLECPQEQTGQQVRFGDTAHPPSRPAVTSPQNNTNPRPSKPKTKLMALI
ncbi:hypothetical protein K493DRAFT_321371 [Basidiobolus meristosporus CBS 931.73]|uniref:Uncharacterized protein n=1 Tax=Basidiobolus meristosporus CBS 931.73 TaxID=1314790 RepID=A0A1Y1WVQ3_9FUNG|nr:hypothetical protein K493DRAFT_321371 [Basidiobolus meristosporus CBS 931.73]|eukprot:ORX77485.1 hypothetical protein K493DRAFT_321371 [Basidiobolus meristosporus CBS 931.73]